MKSKKIIIVGGVAGGASAAARLRRLDEQAEIILFEKGEYISFANCGLPYYIGGEITQEASLTLQTPEHFHARFRVDVRTFQEVTSIHPLTKTVKIKNHITGGYYEESYDKLILSPGANPIRPPVPGIDLPGIFTLRNIPDTHRIKEFIKKKKPRKAIVAGGGYIGVEMAENLHQAGIEVTLVEMQNQVIAPLDYDMACQIHHHMKSKGVRLMLNTELQAVERTGTQLTVTLNRNKQDTDMLILAIGVRPDGHLAAEAGLDVSPKGAIMVDDRMCTSNPHIYAVGDAVEISDFMTGEKTTIPLAGPANKQGRIAADQICDLSTRYTGTQGSAILKVFDMTAASTGINEKTAKRLNIPYDKVFTNSSSHASYYPGAQSMTVKTIFDPNTGKILGAQFVGGQGADKRCDVMAAAIRFGATAKDLTELELCYAPPYSSAKDPVNMAGYVIENLITGKVNQFHWHQISKLPQDGSVTLLDTRTKEEYEDGHIEGFINIPLDSLREHLQELDPEKPVYLTCKIGQRGYLACRILSQSGFTCYNLSGGYLLYTLTQGASTPGV